MLSRTTVSSSSYHEGSDTVSQLTDRVRDFEIFTDRVRDFEIFLAVATSDFRLPT